MTVLTILDSSDDLPELQCEACDSIYTVIWNRNPLYPHIEFCPFCGEEVENIVSN